MLGCRNCLKSRTRYLTQNELKAALEIAPDWLRAPMAFAACTGVRRGEMLSLRWIDVDMDNKRLYLRETKNGALRILPIPEAASLVLRSLQDQESAFREGCLLLKLSSGRWKDRTALLQANFTF